MAKDLKIIKELYKSQSPKNAGSTHDIRSIRIELSCEETKTRLPMMLRTTTGEVYGNSIYVQEKLRRMFDELLKAMFRGPEKGPDSAA